MEDKDPVPVAESPENEVPATLGWGYHPSPEQIDAELRRYAIGLVVEYRTSPKVHDMIADASLIYHFLKGQTSAHS